MPITRLGTWLVALLALVATSSRASAQQFMDLGEFNPDYQLFAPVDIEQFGAGIPGKTGWYGGFSRSYVYVTRPQSVEVGFVGPGSAGPDPLTQSGGLTTFQGNSKTGDFTWGNRIDIGFMTEADHGWMFTHWHVDGPNKEAQHIVERNNRFVMGSPQDVALTPQEDNNSRITGERDYIVSQSLNTADLSSLELNKTWRLKALHKGGRLEPFVGFRYVKFVDYFRRDNYIRFDDTGAIIPIVPPPLAMTATGERYTINRASFINHMVGGQLGGRWYKQSNRLTYSLEARFFALQNFQAFSQQTDVETTIGPATNGTQSTSVREERTQSEANRSEFVWGGEIRADAAFEVTRSISLNVGVNFMEFGQGIGRGNNPNANTEDLTLVGFMFGATINR